MSYYTPPANPHTGMVNTGALQTAAIGLGPAVNQGVSLANQWQAMMPAVGQGGNEVDPLRLGLHLFANRPVLPLVPAVTYPLALDLGSSQMRFHLLTWRHSAFADAASWWRTVEVTVPAATDYSSQAGRLAFYSKRDRRAFQLWWQSYRDRLFAGQPPQTGFLPSLRAGRINGSFVAQPATLDNGDPQWPNIGTLLEVLPAWAWIAGECRRPVFRINGGWLFASATEAAKFVLFNPRGTL